MYLQKSKTLPNGVTADIWRVSDFKFSRNGYNFQVIMDLYLDVNQTISLNFPHVFEFVLGPTEISMATNVISFTYSKVLAKAATDVPDLDNGGTKKFCEDIDGAVLSPTG